MTDMSSMNRETKKKHLRSRVITPGRPPAPSSQESSEEIVKKAERRVRRRHLVILLVLLVLVTVAAIVYYWYQRGYQYKEASVGWERRYERDEAGFVQYQSFEDNLIRYSKDGASYIDARGKDVWVQPYEMRDPIIAVNGGYAAIGDRQGNNIYIFDKNGLWRRW